VRRYAKASTAGSTQRRANGFGRFFRGAVATRSASPVFKGSGAPAVKRLLIPVGVFAAILALMVVAAPVGAKTHLFKEAFGSAAQPSFGSARGIAVDQSTGDVLVMDAEGTPSIKRYKPDGTAADFSALGTNVIDGQGAGDETPQNGLAFSSAAESEIAVDNSGTATDGDIYVTQSYPHVINIFAGTGAYLGQLTESTGGPFSEACGVAVDPAGAVYVGDYSGGIHKFVPSTNPPVNADNTANFTTVTTPCTLAAGAGPTAGFLFPATYSSEISKIDSSTGEVKYTVSDDSNTTVSVDPTSGHVYAASGAAIKEFDASGAGSATSVASTSLSSSAQGVAVRGSSGDIYASRSEGAEVEVFGAGLAAVPAVISAAATDNTGTKATLNGTVDPDGEELSECKFEYGESSGYDQTVPCAESPAAIGAGTAPVSVHADISDLQPNGTKYEFRLVAKNTTSAVIDGESQNFTTPDTVVTATATAVTPTAATLNGTVDPDGVPLTACEFEWGATTAYGKTAPCAPNAAGIGSGTSAVPVSAGIGGLEVGTVYHFRLRAANANGPIHGADESLQTTGPVSGGSWSEGVVFTEATLRAKINPEGNATTVKFEWGPTAAYGQETETLAVGSDEIDHSVSAFLEGLQPGSTYHYRLIATNSAATNEGPDQTFTTFAHFPQNTSCTNQVFRVGPGADLPDCRAYEMVSPVDKNGGDISTLASFAGEGGPRAEINQASVAGNKYTYSSYKAFAGAVGGPFSNQYIATRGADGWSTEPISPARVNEIRPFSPAPTELDGPFRAFSDDLSQSWVQVRSRFGLAPNALPHFLNIYRREADGVLHTVTTNQTPLLPDESLASLDFAGRTPDGSAVLFESEAALTPDANHDGIDKVYESEGGQLQLVSVLPNGEAAPTKSLVGAGYANLNTVTHGGRNVDHAISDDGSRIFWSTFSGKSPYALELYVRLNGTTTIPVSQGEEAYFWTADPSGSRVIYGEPTGIGGTYENLYEFDVDTKTRSLIATEVRGVLGASEDLSYLYLVSKDDLAPGATEGARNLYLDHEGQMRFIATLADLDTGEVGSAATHGTATFFPNAVALLPSERRSRITADGHDIAFMSTRSLTGYDNTDAINGKPDFEVFNYNAESNKLTCVSCNPTGERPVGRPLEQPYSARHKTVYLNGAEFPTAAWLPSWENAFHASRVLSEDGNRLFFNSFDALVPGDSNGKQDLYEWEAQGTGSCHKAEGCISLISTGKSSVDSEFLEATPDGGDVFFRTESSIDPRDPNALDVYDARVGGGFPVPAPPPPACVGDACQVVPPGPGAATPSSASFHGAGNPTVRKSRRSCKARRPRGGGKAHRAAKRISAKHCKRGHAGRRKQG
jgi:hypothetical protein